MRRASEFVGAAVSQQYARVRPAVPPPLVDRLMRWTADGIDAASWSLLLDIGCGTGKATAQIADRLPHGARVIGMDSSDTQVHTAAELYARPNVLYRVHDCNVDLPVDDRSVDMITIIQAAHWFDMPHLCNVAQRKLKVGGVLALIFYPLPKVQCAVLGNEATDRLDQSIKWLNDELQRAGCWASQRLLVTPDQYRSIDMPFDQVLRLSDVDEFRQRDESTVAGLLEFFESWSGVRAYRDRQRESRADASIMDEFEKRILAEFPEDTNSAKQELTMVFPYQLIMGRM